MLPIRMPGFMEDAEWYRYDEKERKYVLTEKAPKKAVKSYNEVYSLLGTRYYMAHSMLQGIVPHYIASATFFWLVNPMADQVTMMNHNFFYLPKGKKPPENNLKARKILVSYAMDAVKSGLYMPCGFTVDEVTRYYVDHEAGHIMQNQFFIEELSNRGWNQDDVMKFVDERHTGIYNPKRYKRYYDILKKVTTRLRKEIIATAKKANPAFSEMDNLSKVAMMSDEEFFAEACANGMSSKPNEIGRAAAEWLDKKKLLGKPYSKVSG